MEKIYLLNVGDGSAKTHFELLLKNSQPKCYSCIYDISSADLVLIIGVREKDLFQRLRAEKVWRQFPQKCFVYSEIDNPPLMLHGIAPSIPSWKAFGHRFTGFHFPLHELRYPNPPPAEPASTHTKAYLCSFLGQRSSTVRRNILNHNWPECCKIIDTSNVYHHFNGVPGESKRQMQRRFWKITLDSHFSLCPRGHGSSAIRIFEAMRAGVVPIILSDSWVPPVGIEWSDCSIHIPECDYKRIDAIAAQFLPHAGQMGQRARQVWEEHFSPDKFSARLKLSIDHIRDSQRIPEFAFASLLPVLTLIEYLHRSRVLASVWMKQRVRELLF